MNDVQEDFPRDPHRYRLVNAGAHRKPPPLVGAPALILHYGLWRPNCTDNQWHEAIDYFLYRTYRKLADDPGFSERTVTPNYDYHSNRVYLFRHFVQLPSNLSAEANPSELQSLNHDRNTRYDVFSIRTKFRGIPITIRAELYSEFWSLDFISDFDCICPDLARDENSPIYRYAKDFDDIYSFIAGNYEAEYSSDTGHTSVENATEPPHQMRQEVSRDRIRQIRQTLHKRFREDIVEYITKDCLDGCRRFGDLPVGIVFGEFHGSVLGLYPDRDRLSSIGVGNNNPAIPKFIPELIGTHKFSPGLAPSVVGALWPFIQEVQRTSESDKKDEEMYGKPEFTVSRFQDGRSLYISSLGWLDPQPDRLNTKPIIYTIVVTYRSRWSLGRLIERIHSMGRFRLAAMYDIERITQAGDRLKRLQDELREAEARLARADGDIDGDHFAKECLLAGSDIKYGLMHRVERSQYYVKSFERHLESLRCRRVEGFQPYDQFVRRRMYGAFDYIRRVGDRYVELREEVGLILRRTNNLKVASIVRRIERTSEEIANMTLASNSLEDRMKSVLERMDQSGEETKRLLSNAEVIITLSLAYYIGHIFSAALSFYAGRSEEKPSDEVVGYLLGMLCAWSLSLHLQRKREEERNRSGDLQKRPTSEEAPM